MYTYISLYYDINRRAGSTLTKNDWLPSGSEGTIHYVLFWSV